MIHTIGFLIGESVFPFEWTGFKPATIRSWIYMDPRFFLRLPRPVDGPRIFFVVVYYFLPLKQLKCLRPLGHCATLEPRIFFPDFPSTTSKAAPRWRTGRQQTWQKFPRTRRSRRRRRRFPPKKSKKFRKFRTETTRKSRKKFGEWSRRIRSKKCVTLSVSFRRTRSVSWSKTCRCRCRRSNWSTTRSSCSRSGDRLTKEEKLGWQLVSSFIGPGPGLGC